MMDGQVASDPRQRSTAPAFPTCPSGRTRRSTRSAYYGPFRDAAECAPSFGDRSSYQQDGARGADEGVREALQDVSEGADAVMVKPAGAYLDVVRAVAEAVDVPVAAYQVSGEYAMVEAAAFQGWVDRRRIILEQLNGHQARRCRHRPHLLGHRGRGVAARAQ